MAPRHRLFLIPGFFGFANLGELIYFSHTRDFLAERLAQRGVDADVISVHTHPTSSIRTRTERLLETVRATASPDGDDVLHLIGHSTGGLDARLFVSPEAKLGDDAEALARRVRSVVTVATPHHGSPLAQLFETYFGGKLLQLLSLLMVYSLRLGRPPLATLFKLGGALTGMESRISETLVEQLFVQLLADFSPDRRDAVARFFHEVGEDQSILPQLTPEGMVAFNAATPDRPEVRYGSVVTMAPPPTLRGRLALGPDPYAQVTHALYTWLHGLTARVPPNPAAVPTPAQLKVLARTLPKLPVPSSNDGIVPSFSQPWGEVLTGAEADHHDVIGHFDDPRHEPPHVDWLVTGSGFRRPAFETVWERVLEFVLQP